MRGNLTGAFALMMAATVCSSAAAESAMKIPKILLSPKPVSIGGNTLIPGPGIQIKDNVISVIEHSTDPVKIQAGDGITIDSIDGDYVVALDNTSVRTSGDQDISGVKTFDDVKAYTLTAGHINAWNPKLDIRADYELGLWAPRARLGEPVTCGHISINPDSVVAQTCGASLALQKSTAHLSSATLTEIEGFLDAKIGTGQYRLTGGGIVGSQIHLNDKFIQISSRQGVFLRHPPIESDDRSVVNMGTLKKYAPNIKAGPGLISVKNAAGETVICLASTPVANCK